MPKKNHIFSRYKFHKKGQADGESFDNFVTELKLLVKDCGYANTAKVKEQLLNYGLDLSLERAVDIARSHEIAQGQLKSMTGPHSVIHTLQVAHACSNKALNKTVKKLPSNPKDKPRNPQCVDNGKRRNAQPLVDNAKGA